jgi:outer membrane protein assembly factor BamB
MRSARAIEIAALLLVVAGAAIPGSVLLPVVAAPQVAAASATDWPMYLHDGSLSAASTETILGSADAPNLRPAWTFKTGGMIAASATVVAGVAYVGSWDGYEYALNATTGAQIWKTYLGITTAPACSPPSLGVSSIPTVTGGVVYLGGGDSNWYALNASTGAVLWTVPTGDNSATGGHYNWASPLIVGNSAYIGIASLGDCPLVQGQLLRVDLTTHLVAATANFVPTGQVGGGVWTTPSIDTSTNTVYVTTGTRNMASQTTSEAMVALDATTLAIKSYWQIPLSAANADSDWGNSPILFSDGNGRAMVAGINKNGFLYAFDRANLAAGPVWSEQIAIGGICPTCGDASVASMAFAGGLLYAAGGNTTIGGVGYPGAIRAINPTNGAVVWARGLASPVIPALAYDNGMIFAGVGPRLEVLDASSGARIGSYATGAVIYSPPSISGGIVYIGSGDGNEYAFSPAAPITPPADPNCPSGFTCADIGSPSPVGSETVTAGSWAINAGGAGVGGASDSIRLMTQAVRGDMSATARVASQSVAGTGTETGLMARQASDPGSPFYSVSVAGGNTVSVQSRTAFGGAVKTVKLTGVGVPRYVEIRRVADGLAAATSTDGVTYFLVPGSSTTVVMPDTVGVGPFATSGLSGTNSASTLDSLTIGAPGAAPAPPASPSACPSGWNCTDVGNPATVGDQSVSGTTYTVSGSGTASTSNSYSDQFHYLWAPIAGDATLSGRIVTQANTGTGAQAGFVFRTNSTDPGAVSYGAFVTPGNGIEVVYRTTDGLRTLLATTAAGAAPAYLQISRYGTTYTTFTSSDGTTWSAIVGSSVTFGSSGAMTAGVVVNSGTTTAGTDTFASLSLAGSAAPPPSLCPSGWTCQDIGFPTPGTGSQYTAGANLTIQVGGSDIWGTYDSFRMVSKPMSSDGTMNVRVDSQANTNPWAKAGVMIRATADPGSAYYAAFITPSNGIAVQYRTTAGGASSQVLLAGTTPVWLEVARTGSTFTASTSSDGVTWSPIAGSAVVISMPGTLLAGLAVTSHNGSAQGSTTFDTYTLTGAAASPPSQPLAVSAIAGDSSAQVYWSAPLSTGGSPITNYSVTASSGGGTCSTTGALTCTVGGLVNGSPYTFTVVAANSVGPGPASTASNSVVPEPVQAGTFHPLSPPLRMLDTRYGNGLPIQKIHANSPVTFAISAQTRPGSQIPVGATAVTGNVTVVDSTFAWAVYLGPEPIAKPTTSSINFTSGQITGNGLTVALSPTGTLSATYVSTPGNSTDLVFDVTGYFTPDSTGATYHPMTPARLLDTRHNNGLSQKLHANTPATFYVTAQNRTGSPVPAGATAVTGNVTVVDETFAWAVFLGPEPTASPGTSTINFVTGDIKGNNLTVALGPGGSLSATYMSTAGNTTDLVFDVTGYYTNDSSGSKYVALNPTRMLDTRFNNGLSQQLSANTPATFWVSAQNRPGSPVPAGATGVTGNVTVVNETFPWAVFLGPDPTASPGTSTINFVRGDIKGNGLAVGLGSGGSLSATYISTAGNKTDLVFDVTGYFTP